jgi:hypothetical protein
MKKLLVLLVLFLPLIGKAETISVKLSEPLTLILPFQVVQGVQLYCPEEGKGFPGLETTLVEIKTWRLSAGAAPVLGTDINVPFVSIATRLSPRVFDTSNNELYFGIWAGKPSNGKHVIFGLSASIPLW